MLEQSLTGRTKQQAGESATTTRTNHDDIMVVARLGERIDRVTRHNRLVDFKIRVSFLNRLDTHVKIFQVRSHHAFVLRSTLDVGHSGNDIELRIPARREVGGDFEGFQPPLGFVGADGYARDLVVQMHQIALIVGIRYDDNRAVRIGG